MDKAPFDGVASVIFMIATLIVAIGMWIAFGAGPALIVFGGFWSCAALIVLKPD